MQDKYSDLEDAVLLIEDEKADWARRMETTSRQLADESGKRQHFETELHNSHVELASHRNTALEAEREIVKAAGEIKARDAEIALLRSRENKTIVEHVHVLEQAKKVTDRQLAEQVKENSRLNTLMKSIESHRNRINADLEDMTRQYEMLKASKSREARSARASMSAEDKDLEMALEDEKKARRAAEAHVLSMEKDLADQRRQLSTVTLSAREHSGLETRLARTQQELHRLGQEHEDVLTVNSRLQNEVNALRKTSQAPSTPKASDSARAELLRGLQQSHDTLSKDMSDQLRRLDAQPLTPSRRANGLAQPIPPSPDPMAGKRMRQLEMEISGLRQQLEDEKEEKELIMDQLREMQGGPGKKGKGGAEEAVYSHFRLKAKSLRSQLDQ